ncbi:DUF968 domain-containing protein [Enterobacter sp. SA187]|uniref:DUF968 domain-containing protein n=1 Tax=Enterobacter sp. SA187 TaxID=1914861 RepID=UPI0009332A24|nr:DUF968 domain-containing protein [Enterobacter sp. SA187]
MRALLKPVVVRELGVVMFRPGAELLAHFSRGRMLLENEPERLAGLPSGQIPPAAQPLAEDSMLVPVFENEKVIARAGGMLGLENWLMRGGECQYPHGTYHMENVTAFHHAPGVIRVCWHCDNTLRGQSTERLAGIARANLAQWIIEFVRMALGFDDTHQLTIPELCWWLVRNDLADVISEDLARHALRLPVATISSVYRESELVPAPAATSSIEEKAKQVLALRIDPESPESFMRRPKRKRWENEKYTRWVKAQPCACCSSPADDPHHVIGYGQGGMGTKAHDLFVIPLCRAHHDELHTDMKAFEKKYCTQPELLLKTLDRALAIGVLA